MYSLDIYTVNENTVGYIHPAFLNFYVYMTIEYHNDLTTKKNLGITDIILNSLKLEPFKCKFRRDQSNNFNAKWYFDFDSEDDYTMFMLKWL